MIESNSKSTVDRTRGVTAPQGFRAAGVAAGIKNSGARDLALVVNDGPQWTAAAVFTRNQVQAAPVLWSRQVLAEHTLRAVVLNSGSANACTGPQGFQLVHATAEEAARRLSTSDDEVGAIEVAVCSTGLIGELPPADELLAGIGSAVDQLAATEAAGLAAADAVRTTDTVPKQTALRHRDGWTVGGFAKGAGMIAPGLATMLVVLTTDAIANESTLDSALRDSTAMTFDRLDIDGAMSTNDTVLLLSSGASRCTPTRSELADALRSVCDDLAEQMQSDAEGVTKRVAITVDGALSTVDAVAVARAVARDRLVATAMFGADPNWGRIIAAVGAGPVRVDPDKIDISINGVAVCRGGIAYVPREKVDMSTMDIAVHIDLHLGSDTTTVRTTDLSHGYVEENSAYSS